MQAVERYNTTLQWHSMPRPECDAAGQAQAPRARAAAVERWAETADAGARAGKLQGLWRVVGKHVEELHTLQAHLSIQQVCACVGKGTGVGGC